MRLIIFLFLGVVVGIKADALVTYDPWNYAQNLLTARNSVTSLLHQTTLISQQLQQLQLATRNSNSVSAYQWRSITALMDRLNQISQQGQALSASSATIDSQFRERYPDYAMAQTNNNYASQYHQWHTTTLDTLRATLEAAGYTTQQFENESALIQQLKTQGQQAQGRMQVLQVSSELAAENVNQLQELKRLLVNQTNAQNAYMAYKLSKAGFREKSLEEIHDHTSSQFPPYKNHQQFSLIPGM